MQTPIDLIDEELYLVQEPQAEYKSEFRNGRVVAMSGASYSHGQIAGNLVGELNRQLKQRPCDVVGSDIRVKVAAAHFYTYPDVSVVCGEPQFDAKDKHALVNPTLIIEVLSPGTMTYDRGEKFEYFKKLESLREYVLVGQKAPHVEIFLRQASGEWAKSVYTKLEDMAELRSIECSVALRDIYHKVKF